MRLHEHYKQLVKSRRTMLGYPLNCTPVAMHNLHKFLGFVINNLGDPYAGGSYQINSFNFEREIVQFFMNLFNLPQRSGWGYVSNCGSESNMRGLSFGNLLYPNALIYTSDQTHYSVDKSCRVMGVQLVEIKTDRFHRIDLKDFRSKLEWDRPAVVNVNVGTTMAGAIDNVAGVCELLEQVPHYIHVDAALSGLIAPFLPEPPLFDFRLPISSITVSGHKMLGCPIPCGVFVCRKEVIETRQIEYLGSRDTTMCGSRDGFTILLLWHLLFKHYRCTLDGDCKSLEQMAKQCMRVKTFALEELCQLQWKHWHNGDSTTIMLEKPPDRIVRKWQLAVRNGEAHAIIMPHVTVDMISEFVQDLTSPVKRRKQKCVRSY